MTCPECQTGVLSRNRKPDALGRIVEKCDACKYQKVITQVTEPATLPARSMREAHALASTNLPLASTSPADHVLVVGKPCPCCHRKVKALPRTAEPRHCMKCGVLFTPKRGEKLPGLEAARCPKHRTASKAVQA